MPENVLFLEILKNLLAILAIVLPAAWGLWSTARSRWGYVPWWRISKGVALLRRKMGESNYRPACIVCIGRAGAIVGSLLSEHFGPPLVPIVVLTFDYPQQSPSTAATLRHPQYVSFGTIRAGLDNVLLIGIDVMSGETMREALAELERAEVTVSATACVFWNPDALLKPTYLVYQSKVRAKFPWHQRTFREKYGIPT